MTHTYQSIVQFIASQMFTCVIDVSNATRDEKRELIFVANAISQTFFNQTDMHVRINDDKTYYLDYTEIDLESVTIDTTDESTDDLCTERIAFDDIRKIELIVY